MEALKANKSMKHSAAMAYHPEPRQALIETPTGWVRCTPGETGYTLNSGETIRL